MRACLWLAQGGWAIETIEQGECPKITASNFISSKGVQRLLALLVVLWLLDGCQWKRNVAHPNAWWSVPATLVQEVCDALWATAGMSATRGSHLKRDTCGMAEAHATFLCIPLAQFKGLTHRVSSGLSVLAHLQVESWVMGGSPVPDSPTASGSQKRLRTCVRISFGGRGPCGRVGGH